MGFIFLVWRAAKQCFVVHTHIHTSRCGNPSTVVSHASAHTAPYRPSARKRGWFPYARERHIRPNSGPNKMYLIRNTMATATVKFYLKRAEFRSNFQYRGAYAMPCMACGFGLKILLVFADFAVEWWWWCCCCHRRRRLIHSPVCVIISVKTFGCQEANAVLQCGCCSSDMRQ